jgi:hypothetical protein
MKKLSFLTIAIIVFFLGSAFTTPNGEPRKCHKKSVEFTTTTPTEKPAPEKKWFEYVLAESNGSDSNSFKAALVVTCKRLPETKNCGSAHSTYSGIIQIGPCRVQLFSCSF